MNKLLLALCLSIEAFSFFLYNRILFSSSKNRFHQIITYFLSYSFVFIFHIFSSHPFIFINIFVFFIANSFIIFFLYKQPLLSAALHAIMISCFSIISEIIVGNISQCFASYFSDKWIDINSLFSLCPSAITFFSLTIFSAYIEKKLIEKGAKNTVIVLILTFSSFCLLSALFNYLGIIISSNIERKNFYLKLNIIVYIVLIASFILIINYIRHKERITARQQQIFQSAEDTSAFINKLKERDIEQRILIHDIKKHLSAIKIMLDNDNLQDIKTYIECIFSSPVFSGPLRYCSNDFINSILFKYMKEAEKNNVLFSINSTSANFSFLNNYDLTIILCNLLDNSLEAASKSQNGSISITLSYDDVKEVSKIIIVNTCNEIVKFSKGLPLSNKPNTYSHGLGISSVLKIVEKYNGEFSLYQDNYKKFHTILIFYGGKENENSNM